MFVPMHAYLHVGGLQVCVPLFACEVLCLCVCRCGGVFWPTRSVPCAQTSRVIHQGDSTNQIKQETNYSSLHSFGAETQREHTTGGEASFLTSTLLIWHLSPVLYFRRGKTDSSWEDWKQGRGSENLEPARSLKNTNTIVCFSMPLRHAQIYMHVWVHVSKQQQHNTHCEPMKQGRLWSTPS